MSDQKSGESYNNIKFNKIYFITFYVVPDYEYFLNVLFV